LPEPPEPDDGLVRAIPSAECPVGTPQEPELRVVTLGDTELIVTRLSDGEVVAFAARCPHQGTDLTNASFFDGQLRCPHHLYLYDPRTGENLVPTRAARPENLWRLRPGHLPVYRVEEREGWIWVGARPCPPPASYDAERERPPTPAEQARRAAVSVGVDAQAPQPAPVTVEHPTKTVRVRPGAVFELRLPVSPRPGHVWRVEVGDGPVTLLETGFDPGDPPRHRVRLSAGAAGVVTVRCAFARPWEEVAAEVRSYVVRVESSPAT
jgi:nitrite reductase/ring-hydroxylating ferredoxin subunit/predicted secreted protein